MTGDARRPEASPAGRESPPIVVVMGVSGAGKTTVGRLLADDLGWRFYEGDDFHPPQNVEKMSRGIPLTDGDRLPWLDALRDLVRELGARGEPAVLACSLLKKRYRERVLGRGSGARLVYLKVAPEVVEGRLERRRGHFMRAGMAASQFAVLEEPEGALVVDGTRDPKDIVREVERGLRLAPSRARVFPGRSSPHA